MLYIIVILIVLGMLALVAEVVLLPGVTVAGICAFLCNAGAIYLAFEHYGAVGGAITAGIVALLALALIIFSLRSKTWQRLSLSAKIDSSSMKEPQAELKLGDSGVSLSRLAPMGKIEVLGRSYEAKSHTGYIDEGKAVEVVGFENFSVIVKQKL